MQQQSTTNETAEPAGTPAEHEPRLPPRSAWAPGRGERAALGVALEAVTMHHVTVQYVTL